jgi:hypothetical protein
VRRVRAETWLAIAACAAAALWIDLGHFHRIEDGDSMLPVLISLQRWTPFYWEQDRFGQLVPLLAMPFKDPLVNLLVQRGLFLFAGLCSFLAAARWAFGRERWQLLGLVAAALWAALMPFVRSYEFLGHNPYALSMLLGFLALIAAEGQGHRAWRWPATAALMLLSHWVSSAMFVFLVPAALARGAALAAGRRGAERWPPLWRGLREAGWSLGGGAAAWAFNKTGAAHAGNVPRVTALVPVPVQEWPHAWAELGRHLWVDQAPQWLFWACLLISVAGAVVTSRSPRWREEAADATRIGLGLFVASAGYFLVVAVQQHVVENLSLIRYLFPVLPLLELSLLALAVLPLEQLLEAQGFRRACGVAGACLLGASAFTFGLPAPGHIREDLEAVSPITPEVIALRCTHVAGYYWKVWPAVVMANAARYQRGERGQVYGIAHRAGVTLDLATAMRPEDVRIGVALDDPEAMGWLRAYRFPNLTLLERGQKIAVLGIQGAHPAQR